MKMSFKHIALILVATPLLGFACPSKSVIFSCETVKGKMIEVCDNSSTIVYSFGKPNQKPEITVNAKRNSVTTYQWSGMGSWMSYSVNIPNGKTNYNVFWGVDRNDENHPVEAGVQVNISGKTVATVQCNKDKITNNMEGVDLPLEQ